MSEEPGRPAKVKIEPPRAIQDMPILEDDPDAWVPDPDEKVPFERQPNLARNCISTRRDQMAVTIMARLITSQKPSTFSENGWTQAVQEIADRSVRAADLLLARLDRGGGGGAGGEGGRL